MLSVLQLPVPPEEHTKHFSLPQRCGLKGLDCCNWLFNVIPVFSTTLIRKPLLVISRWYMVFSSPSGVAGTKRTESKPPSLYHDFFFCRYSSSRSCLLQLFSRFIGRIPWFFFSLMICMAFSADFTTLYLKVCVYPENCNFFMKLFTCPHTISHGR